MHSGCFPKQLLSGQIGSQEAIANGEELVVKNSDDLFRRAAESSIPFSERFLEALVSHRIQAGRQIKTDDGQGSNLSSTVTKLLDEVAGDKRASLLVLARFLKPDDEAIAALYDAALFNPETTTESREKLFSAIVEPNESPSTFRLLAFANPPFVTDRQRLDLVLRMLDVQCSDSPVEPPMERVEGLGMGMGGGGMLGSESSLFDVRSIMQQLGVWDAEAPAELKAKVAEAMQRVLESHLLTSEENRKQVEKFQLEELVRGLLLETATEIGPVRDDSSLHDNEKASSPLSPQEKIKKGLRSSDRGHFGR